MSTTTINVFKSNIKTKEVIKKKERLVIKLAKSFVEKFNRWYVTKTEIKLLEEENQVYHSEILKAGREEFVRLYKKTGVKPDSLQLEAGDQRILFMPIDKEIELKQAEFTFISKELGKRADLFIKEEVSYTMDSEMIEKYGDIISELIVNCEKISSEDKFKLVQGTRKFKTRKGAINNLLEAKSSLSIIVEKIQFQLKQQVTQVDENEN